MAEQYFFKHPDLVSLEVEKRGILPRLSHKRYNYGWNMGTDCWVLIFWLLKVAYTIVEGRVVVQDGRLVRTNLDNLLTTHARLTRQLINGS